MNFARNDHFIAVVSLLQAERTTVKRLVVHHAQRQSVWNLIRATMRVPFDVGSLQSQEFIFQTKIKAAHGATVLVRV